MNHCLRSLPGQVCRLAAVLSMLTMICSEINSQNPAPGSSRSPLAAPVRNVKDTYFGVSVDDPYRYMEDLKNPEVASWIKAQADYTNTVLASIPGRVELGKRIMELDESVPERVNNVQVLPGPVFFYEKQLASDNLPHLYMRQGLVGAETLLVNPELNAAKDAPHMVLSYWAPSQDGHYVAYGVAPGGGEDSILHVLDTQTMRETGDVIDRARWASPSFLATGKSFAYLRFPKLGPNAAATDAELNAVNYLHVLGTNPDTDVPIFGNGIGGVSTAPMDFPMVSIIPGSQYALGFVEHGVQNELTFYVAREQDLGKAGLKWKKIIDVSDDVTGFSAQGDDLFLLSHHGASRFKVVRMSLSDPDIAHAEVVVPASDNVLRNLNAAKDALYIQELHDGMGKLLRMAYDSKKVEEVKLPFEGSVTLYTTDARVSGAYIGVAGWTRGFRILTFDPTQKVLADTHLNKPGRFDNPTDLESVEVKVRSHDGTMVPLSIVYRKGTKLDGSHPLLMDGYGAYGITYDPYFDPTRLAWFERGGIFAVAHVRGGGEYGQDWYLAGKMLTKPNTWKDFIACAEYLIENNYTSASRLSIMGGSAGGITVGRTITERPDLFAVAIDFVPMSDTVRTEFTPNGPPNIPEFGTVADENGFKALYEMSAYHHVKDGTRYPAVLILSGINDSRVATWQPAKLAARLQAATSSGRPILFRVDYDGGHGFANSKTQHQKEATDLYSFIFWQIGRAGFQPSDTQKAGVATKDGR